MEFEIFENWNWSHPKMSKNTELVIKLCSSLNKYLDKKSVDKILPLLKELDDQKPKDLKEKELKNVYEVCSRVIRKIDKKENEEIVSIASSLKLKFPKPEKHQTEVKKVDSDKQKSSKKVCASNFLSSKGQSIKKHFHCYPSVS